VDDPKFFKHDAVSLGSKDAFGIKTYNGLWMHNPALILINRTRALGLLLGNLGGM